MSDGTPGLRHLEGVTLFGIDVQGGSLWKDAKPAPLTREAFERAMARPVPAPRHEPILVSAAEYRWYRENDVIDSEGRLR